MKKKYEYNLPNDEKRLVIDAVVFAGVDAIHDGPNMMSREIIEEKAKCICERFKTETKAEYATNDFDEFNKIVINNYVSMYLEKQKNYREDITTHQKEVEMAMQYDDMEFKVRYRIFVERAVMGGKA
jgi:hypothetical protein